MTRGFAFALLLALAAMMSPAQALSSRDAEKVVTLIEALAAEGEAIAYDEQEADEWFEEDSTYENRIPAAGFTRDSWKTAFDALMTGYFALIPQTEIDAMLNAARLQLSQAAGLTAEQKAELAASFEDHVAKIGHYRETGRVHMDVVRPLLPRLKRFVD